MDRSWLEKGNKLKFTYNGNWECYGKVVDVYEDGSCTKFKLEEVIIDDNDLDNYTFNLPSVKDPEVLT